MDFLVFLLGLVSLIVDIYYGLRLLGRHVAGEDVGCMGCFLLLYLAVSLLAALAYLLLTLAVREGWGQ